MFNAPYDSLLFDVERLAFPHAGSEQATLDALESACRRGTIAALIVEPLILGAGGMLIGVVLMLWMRVILPAFFRRTPEVADPAAQS